MATKCKNKVVQATFTKAPGLNVVERTKISKKMRARPRACARARGREGARTETTLFRSRGSVGKAAAHRRGTGTGQACGSRGRRRVLSTQGKDKDAGNGAARPPPDACSDAPGRSPLMYGQGTPPYTDTGSSKMPRPRRHADEPPRAGR